VCRKICSGRPQGGVPHINSMADSEANAIFDELDSNKDGKLKRQELRDYIDREFGGSKRASQIARLFDKMDRDGDNRISRDEFVEAFARYRHELKNESNIREAFSVFDTDGTGTLSAEELCSILTQPTEGNRPFTQEEANALIRKFDTNGDGELQLEEFVQAFATVMPLAAGTTDSNPIPVATPSLEPKAEGLADDVLPPGVSGEIMYTFLERSAPGQSLGLGLDDDGPAIEVAAVTEGSPADSANLVEGDLIITVDGTPLSSANLKTLLRADLLRIELGVIRPPDRPDEEETPADD